MGTGPGAAGTLDGTAAYAEPAVADFASSLRAASSALHKLDSEASAPYAEQQRPSQQNLLGVSTSDSRTAASDFSAVAKHAEEQALAAVDDIPGVVFSTPRTAHSHFASLWPVTLDARAL